jgi:excisionase family DNA binding protein
MDRHFLPLADVADILSVSSAQAYALVRSGDLPAIKVGGRGQWRVEESELDAYIDRMYEQTRAMVRDSANQEQGVDQD